MICKEDREIILQFCSALTNPDEAHGDPGNQYVKVPLTVAKAVGFQLQCIVLKDLAEYKSDLEKFLRNHEIRPFEESTPERRSEV